MDDPLLNELKYHKEIRFLLLQILLVFLLSHSPAFAGWPVVLFFGVLVGLLFRVWVVVKRPSGSQV